MNNLLLYQLGASLIGDVLWQSGMFLGVGLVVSLALTHRPARAHRVLLLVMVGALVTPLFSQLVHSVGWGFLSTSAAHHSPPVVTTSTAAISSSIETVQPTSTAAVPRAASPAEPLLTITRPDGAERLSAADRLITSISTRNALVGLWCVLSGLSLVRLAVSLVQGHRMVGRARLIACESTERAVDAACTRLGLQVRPVLRASSRVACPAIWCWGRRPVIVLPDAVDLMAARVDWVGVFCHELAHWLRRDQWSSLLGELLVCALPWHPLAWWAKYRMGQLSELACDDWVLATGLPAADYAESLLGLVPQWRTPLALTAVSSRRGLFGRVRHILDERRSSPDIGRRWACLSAAVMVLMTSALALAQSRPVELKNPVPNSSGGQANASSVAPPSQKETAMNHTIRGNVLGPDGKPASGATVFWIGNRKPPVPFVAMPKDQESSHVTEEEILGQAETDTSGKFSLSADYDPDRYIRFNGWDVILLAKASGAGMLSHPAKADENGVTLRLPPEVVIRGRLLTPAGMPASDVRVTVNGFNNDQTHGGMYIGLTPTDAEIPPCWFRPRKTDSDGRFILDGAPQGTYVNLTFWPPDFAVDEVTINTTTDGSITPGLRAFEITPVKPTFTHTLEPARPVQGRVTDKETGKPLAGLLVTMTPMRRHGGMAFTTRTDAEGRYRVSGHTATSNYFTSVYPPAYSGYLAASENNSNWPAGAKVLEKNFALEKGRIVRGQVIDADTLRPVVGAAVVYQPKRGNPNDRNYDLRNTVLTDKAGKFAITTLPGQGFLAVETPDESYLRIPVEGNYRENRTIFPQGLATVDVSKEGEPKPVEIAVRKGVTLKAKAIGPDGRVVSDVVGSCEGIDAKLINVRNSGQPFANGVFRLHGADPSRTYRVYLLQYERGIGAVVDLKPDPQAKQPVEVKFEPTAKVHGRVVAASGSPMQGGQVYPLLVIRDKEGEMSRDDVLRNTSFYSSLVGQKNMIAYSEKQKSNSQGEFVIDTLLPGVRLYIMAASADNRSAGVPLSPLKPGEDRDLGTITLKEQP